MEFRGKAAWLLSFLIACYGHSVATADVDYAQPTPAYPLTDRELEYVVIRAMDFQLRPEHVLVSSCEFPRNNWQNECRIRMIFRLSSPVSLNVKLEYDGCHWVLRTYSVQQEVEQNERNICGVPRHL